MLKTILSISGKPGLYKLISQGKNMLIVESVNAEKKRFPAYGNEKIISLADIAMYTDDAHGHSILNVPIQALLLFPCFPPVAKNGCQLHKLHKD